MIRSSKIALCVGFYFQGQVTPKALEILFDKQTETRQNLKTSKIILGFYFHGQITPSVFLKYFFKTELEFTKFEFCPYLIQDL
jgi:hypothetical protein